MCDSVVVVDSLWWDIEEAEHIRNRSSRYPGATDIDPAWTLEAAVDLRSIVRAPDPKSRTGAGRLIGDSPSAGFVVTVIFDLEDEAGITAWKTVGADLRNYLEQK